MNYKYGNKNNWRRWVWNRLAERLPDKDDAIILYLPGPLDIDREIGISKGFKDHNLIAVENDPVTLAKIRSSGRLAINGELSNVLLAWPQERPVSAVIGDFCCGLERGLQWRLRQSILFKLSFCRSVFAFNFLRGRDPSSNFIRETFMKGEIKHRGWIFHALIMMDFFNHCRQRGWAQQEIEAFYDKWQMLAHPIFRSYKSGVQRFDSVIFTNSFTEVPIFLEDDLTQGMKMRRTAEELLKTLNIGKGSAERKRVSAIMAHRTMRLN